MNSSNNDSTPWTLADDAAAKQQGWALFTTDRTVGQEADLVDGEPYGHRPYELMRLDEEETFEDDDSAWRFVYQNFLQDEETATRALAFLQRHSPAEYSAILKANHSN